MLMVVINCGGSSQSDQDAQGQRLKKLDAPKGFLYRFGCLYKQQLARLSLPE